jgi:hypothetical protein
VQRQTLGIEEEPASGDERSTGVSHLPIASKTL